MKVVINQGGVKRELDGPFEICVDMESLATLSRCLNEAMNRDHGFGWICVYDKPSIDSMPDTKPLPWK